MLKALGLQSLLDRNGLSHVVALLDGDAADYFSLSRTGLLSLLKSRGLLLPDRQAVANAIGRERRSIAPLCVRVHRLTILQAQRICKWAENMLRVDVLADVTLDTGKAAVQLLNEHLSFSGLHNVRIVEFTSTDMEAKYPSLQHECLEAYRRKYMWMLLALSHAWAFTAEAVTVCQLGLEEESDSHVRHTWFFEHDADFAGDIGVLLEV